MNHHHKKTVGFGRAAWFIGLIVAAHCQPARAIEAVADESASQALQCLQRRAKPPQYPEADLQQRRSSTGFMRVKLDFVGPDKPPKVEVLANTASERIQDEVLDYIASYRLPCMKPEFGAITAVQEFIFDALATPEGKPLRLTEESAGKSACLVMPRRAPEPPSRSLDRGSVNVIIQARFAGDGQQPPMVRIIHSDASRAVEQMVTDYLAEYRMPCRQNGDRPYAFEQQFMLNFDGAARVTFKEKQMPLGRFLASVKAIQEQQVYFDLNSMACPFQLDWSFMQPVAPNRVHQVGKPDLNRVEFMAWLETLDLNLPARQAKSLIGDRLVIDVPCGVLDLKKKTSST